MQTKIETCYYYRVGGCFNAEVKDCRVTNRVKLNTLGAPSFVANGTRGFRLTRSRSVLEQLQDVASDVASHIETKV